jgi:phosphatidylinositol-3-phosphatase
MNRAARPRVLALLLPLTLAVGGCGGSRAGAPLPLPRSPAALPVSTRSRVVVIVMENAEFSDVIGGSQAPFVNALARRSAVATRYYGVSHPSLPNYLALTGGSTFGIRSDCTSCSVSARNLADQLDAAHISWRAYMEDLPFACDGTAGVGGYAKKHDPFI